MEKLKVNTVEEAIHDFREGKFVIVVDDEDRENEGDLICAAEKITPEMVNFMLKYARGVLCAPVTISRSIALALPPPAVASNSTCHTKYRTTPRCSALHSPSPSTRSKDARLACLHMTALPPLRH